MTSAAQPRRTTPLHACDAPHACPRPVRMQVLGQARYFAGLTPDELDGVDARMRVRGYVEGESLYSAGDPATSLFVLASGKVKLVRQGLDGAQALVDVVTPGRLFGTLTTLGEPTYPDTAEALTVACALAISADDFRAVMSRYPPVALAVLDDVAQRLEESRQAVRRLSSGTVEQRVAATLLALADTLGERRGDGVLLQLPLTRNDLAAMTGSTPESVSRVMSRLRRDGVVDSGRRWTAVLDAQRLRELADASGV